MFAELHDAVMLILQRECIQHAGVGDPHGRDRERRHEGDRRTRGYRQARDHSRDRDADQYRSDREGRQQEAEGTTSDRRSRR